MLFGEHLVVWCHYKGDAACGRRLVERVQNDATTRVLPHVSKDSLKEYR